ncbi:hypothetical protein GBAR_LOCUS19010, partial [Geodia barretti]
RTISLPSIYFLSLFAVPTAKEALVKLDRKRPSRSKNCATTTLAVYTNQQKLSFLLEEQPLVSSPSPIFA